MANSPRFASRHQELFELHGYSTSYAIQVGDVAGLEMDEKAMDEI